MGKRRYAARDAEISRAISGGQSIRSIAADYGLAVSTVYCIARREGWTWHRGKTHIPRFCDLPGCSNKVPRASNRYCSHTCFVASRRLHLHQCANCEKPVKRISAKFCSRSCYHACARRYWSAANGKRNGRIARDAASGTPHTRIASSYGIHSKTVSSVLLGPPQHDDRTCHAPGCNAPTPRRYRRFCSRSCFLAWNEQQRPWCLNGCGARARFRSSLFCGPLCRTVYTIRQTYFRNLVRDDCIVLAAMLRIPHSEIARRMSISEGYVTVILRRRRRPLLAASHDPSCFKDDTQ
ncbi:MAG: hypothetical protein OXI73_03715 [Rhodospirillales bacterium]|nr:hypothetical protein [Alphaproteobacteria bacterium]MDE0371636.1 hypothetical protein [Rhodospirillales bacterium]